LENAKIGCASAKKARALRLGPICAGLDGAGCSQAGGKKETRQAASLQGGGAEAVV